MADVVQLPPPAAPLPAKKRCISCYELQPIDAFYRLHKGSEARQSRCKRCDNLVRGIGVRAARGLLEAAGAAHQLDLQREREARSGPILRVVPLARAISAGEEEGEAYQAPVKPPTDDEAEALLFGAIAGTYMLAGVRAVVAWDRANEWLEEHPGQLPEGFEALPPQPKAGRPALSLVTPPERRTEPPADVDHMIPRERGGAPDLFDERARMGGFEEEPERLSPPPREAAPRAPRPSTPPQPTTPAPAPEKESDMDKQPIRGAIFAALKSGPKTVAELAEAIGRDNANVTSGLGTMRTAGLVTKEDGYGKPWALVEGATLDAEEKPAKAKKPRTIADVAKKAAKKQARKAKAAKANGHAAPAPAPSTGSAMGDAVAMLKAALTEDFNRKLQALEVLAK